MQDSREGNSSEGRVISIAPSYGQSAIDNQSNAKSLIRQARRLTINLNKSHKKKGSRHQSFVQRGAGFLMKTYGSTDEEDGDVSTSSELGSLDDFQDSCWDESPRKIEREGRQDIRIVDSNILEHSVLLLYIIKINNRLNYQEQQPVEYFKMKLDCQKCSTEGENNQDLRKFRRRVKRKFKMGDGYKLYNYQGYLIQEEELSFLNQEGHTSAVIYVSSSGLFDYEAYLSLFSEAKKLGEGGFGKVYLGEHIVTRQQYAIKVINPTVFKADEASKAFKEAQVLHNLKHKGVIKLFSVFQLSDMRIVMVMEYIEGGTLREYFDSQTGGFISENEAQRMMNEIGTALNYCHQRRIVHRDIKPENIMLRQRGCLSEGLVIIDFGIAGRLQNLHENHQEGTIRYSPPELMTGSSYKADPSFDVWSLGVLLYKSLFGLYPFDGTSFSEIKLKIINHCYDMPAREDVSDTCKALITLMLSKEPKKRPKLHQLLQHEWFTFTKQHQLMHSTLYQQSTLMNFFKQELKNIEASKDLLQQKKNDDILLLQDSSLDLNRIQSSGVFLKFIQPKEGGPGAGTDQEQDYASKKNSPRNYSPSPVAHIRQAGNEQHRVAALKVSREESISSLSLKKQQLMDIRNFISYGKAQDNYQQPSSFKNLKPQQMQLIEKVPLKMNANMKRWESHHRRNPNTGLADEDIKSEQYKFKVPSSIAKLNYQSSESKPPSRFHNSIRKEKKEDTTRGKLKLYPNDARNIRLLELIGGVAGIVEGNIRSNVQQSIDLPEIDSPVRNPGPMLQPISFGSQVSQLKNMPIKQSMITPNKHQISVKNTSHKKSQSINASALSSYNFSNLYHSRPGEDMLQNQVKPILQSGSSGLPDMIMQNISDSNKKSSIIPVVKNTQRLQGLKNQAAYSRENSSTLINKVSSGIRQGRNI